MFLNYTGEAAALLTAIVWAGSSQFHGVATRLIGVGGVTLLRIPYNIVLLAIIFLLLRPENVFSPEAVAYIAAAALFGIAFCDTSFYQAVYLIGPRLSCLVQSMSSCFTAILAYMILGESIGLVGALGIAVAVFGIFFVLAEGGNLRVTHAGQSSNRDLLRGVAMGFFSAIMLAASLICTKQALLSGVSPIMSGVMRLTFGGLMLGGYFLCKGRIGKIWSTFRYTPASWKYMLIGGFLTSIGVWMSGEAVKYTEAGVAATIIALEPVMIIPINAIYERKKPSARAIIGTFIAFSGIAVLVTR